MPHGQDRAVKRVIVIGLDGLDPAITDTLLNAGELPNLARLRGEGGYRRLATTIPAQTPVAWSSFATGVNPGGHGIYDFLRRDPMTYRPEVALFAYERTSRLLPPRPVNQRGGAAVWEVLAEAGVASVVLRHPCTFPPSKSVRGRVLAGVGVPDLRGSFGTSTVYTSDEELESGESEVVVRIEPEDGVARTYVPGPHGQEEELRFEIMVRFDADAGEARIESSGSPGRLKVGEGQWSDWLRLKFRAGAFRTMRGRVRFYLVRARAPCLLYASPVNFDPEVPLHPISEPWDYAWELDRTLEGYHTLGMAEDHNGLNNGRLSEEAYLAQCAEVRNERLAMLHYELERHEEGLLYCLFDTPDRVQHMFWRYREEDHPANRTHPRDPGMARVLEDEYRACDDAVGQALAYADQDTLFLVASDHGFASFQRELHLNSWLHENGFLVLEGGSTRGTDGRASGDGPADGLARVDWHRTRAYALGLTGIYLNLAGRERDGRVRTEDAPEVAAAIADRLSGLVDADRDETAVRKVELRDTVYRGQYVEGAPDLLVRCAPGYRTSAATALGGIPETLFSDNRKRWSGDHVVDPDAVPGILFSNRPIESSHPRIIDLAPTILRALRVPVPDGCEGEALLS